MNARVAPPDTDKAERQANEAVNREGRVRLSEAVHAAEVLNRLPDYCEHAALEFDHASRQSLLIAESLRCGDIKGAAHHLEMLLARAGNGKKLFREIAAATDEAKRINDERTTSREPERAAA